MAYDGEGSAPDCAGQLSSHRSLGHGSCRRDGRHRFDFGKVEGPLRWLTWKRDWRKSHPITVPAVTIDGAQDPPKPGGTADQSPMFQPGHEHRVVGRGQSASGSATGFAYPVVTVQGWGTLGEEPHQSLSYAHTPRCPLQVSDGQVPMRSCRWKALVGLNL